MDIPIKSNFLMVCCLSLVFLFISISHVFAIDLSSEEREYLSTKGTIVFVSQTRYPPFEITDANRQHEGMMLDIARWIAVEMGFKPVFTNMTFQQAQEAILSGKADILTSLFYSDKRKEMFEFTETLYDVPASIFIRAERTDIKDISDLNGKTIAIQRGDYARDFLESKKIRFNTLETNDFAEATDSVVAGNADAVIGDEQIVYYHIFSNRLTDYTKKVGEPLYIGRNCMASNRNNAILISILNKGIHEARKSGVLDKISAKWLGTKYGPQKYFLERYLWPLSAATGGILLLSLWVWIWNIRLRTLVRKKTEVITRREEALQESEAKYRELVENANSVIYKRDTEGKIIFFNEFAQKFFGYSEKEMIGKNVVGTILPEVDPLGRSLADVIRDVNIHPEKYAYHEKECIRKSGETVWVGWSNKPLIDENGSVRQILCIGTDITKRRQAEDRLHESEKNFRTFFDTVDDMILVGSPDGKILHANPTVSKKLGYSQGELKQMHILDLHPAERHQKAEAIFAAMFKGELDVCPLPLQGKTGELVPVETRVWFGKWNGADCIFGISKDLTKEQEALQKFNRLFNNNPALMAVSCLPEGRFTDVNDAFLNTLGYSREEVIGKTSTEMGLFFQSEKHREMAEQLQAHGRVASRELKVKCKDGTIIDGLFSGEIIENQGQKYFLTAMIDQTERKRAEEATQISEAKFRTLFESANDAIFLMDQDIIIDCNPKTLEMFGCAREQIIGQTPYRFSPEVQPDGRKSAEKVQQKIETVFKGQAQFFEWKHNRYDGSLFDAEVSLNIFIVEGKYYLLAIVRDISERKRMEEELIRVHKLESLGVLAGGIAHDFNNLMAIVQGYIDLALLDLPPDHVSRRRLLTAIQCVEQTKDLTSRLITFSRGGSPHRKICDVAKIVRDAVRRTVKGTDVNEKFDFMGNLWPAEIDELQIKQCFYNLTANAVEAMPEGGTITVQAENVEIHAGETLPLKEGSYLKMTFTDEGTGIPEEHLAKVFDPYFTTKEMGAQKGMGLGLSVCYSVLKNHDGDITVKSQPWNGSSFVIYLPARPDQTEGK